MLFSKSTGTLVCDQKVIPSDVWDRLSRLIPGEDPFMDFRALLCVRGDELTIVDRIRELSEWMDLYGRIRLSGCSYEDILKLLSKSGVSLDSRVTGVRREARLLPVEMLGDLEDHRQESLGQRPTFNGRKKLSSKTPKLAVGKPKDKPAVLDVSVKAVSPAGSLAVGSRLKSLTREDTAVVDSVEGSGSLRKATIRWSDGRTQLVTMKTLRDPRRYRLV